MSLAAMGHAGQHRCRHKTYGSGGKVKKVAFKARRRAPKLKKSLTPGSVVILLTGRYRGRRAVFTKQLEKSGLIMVTGPFSVNKVPHVRVDQKEVIATSLKVDLKGADYSARDDAFFKKKKDTKKKKDETSFFAEEAEEKKDMTDEQKDEMNKMDGPLA